MITGLAEEPDVRASILRYSVPNWCAIALMIVGSFLDHEVRIGFWIAAIAVVVAGTIRAGSSEWLVRPGHFAERHGLIVIIAFGEVIVALGVPVAANLDDGGNLSAPTLAALVAAGTFAGLLWWGYFDRPSPAIEHRHTEHDDPIEAGRFARDVYTYIHTPIVAGVLISAAALEQITQHPTEPLPSAFRWMLFSGLALYLLGVALAVARAFRVVAIERTVATVVLGVAIAVAVDVDAVVLIVIVDAILFAMLAIEHQRVEVKFRELAVGQQV
jgi:low temperature requirement protein LtrA